MVRKKTPTEIIGLDKSHSEKAYIKVPGKLREMPQQRLFGETNYKKADIQKILGEENRKNYSSVHTHPTKKEKFIPYSPTNLPSDIDLRTFLYNPREKTMIIGEKNIDTGDVLGYTIIKKTKKTPTNFSFDLLENLNNYMRNQTFENPGLIRKLLRKISGQIVSSDYDPEQEKFLIKRKTKDPKIYKKVLEEFCDRYNLQYRSIPVKGYGLSPEKSSEINFNGLESTIVKIFIFSGVLLFLLVTFTNLTGFAISSILPKVETNSLLILSLSLIFGAFFYRIILKKLKRKI